MLTIMATHRPMRMRKVGKMGHRASSNAVEIDGPKLAVKCTAMAMSNQRTGCRRESP